MLRRPPEGSATVAWGLACLWIVFLFAVLPRFHALLHRLDPLGCRWLAIAISLTCLAALLLPPFRSLRRGDVVWCAGQRNWLLALAFVASYGLLWLHDRPEQALHAVGYGMLAVLIFRGLVFRRRDRSVYVVAACLAIAIAFADELIQWMMPGRSFRFRDLGVDAVGAALTMLMIAAGWRPPFIAAAWPDRSKAEAYGAIAMVGACLFVCVSCTPARIAAWLPTIGAPRETMIEYGQRCEEPGIGVFFSRLTRDDFARAERERGETIGLVLENAGRDPASYEAFLIEYTPVSDPVLHEARVHLYRRDRHAGYARLHADDPERLRAEAWVALREHQFLASRLPVTMQRPALALPELVVAATTRLSAPVAPYVSPVSDHLFTAASEGVVRSAVSVPTLALAGLAGLFLRRAGRADE